jgi:AcrR family transcriptional regulator
MLTTATGRSTDTKNQLIDAAETIIAEHGIDGASVRAITEAASANLAAVNYHFGSKEGLVRAVFERRLRPINRERLRLLDECTARSGAPQLDCVVRAFLLPSLQILQGEHAPIFGRCMIRALADPGEQMKAMLMEAFEEVIERFTSALADALPGEDREGIFWRFHFMIGSMAYTIGMGHLVEEYSRGVCSCEDFEEIGERLVRFVTAGMRATAEEA